MTVKASHRTLLGAALRPSRLGPRAVNALVGKLSAVGTEPFLDPADFPWTRLLEDNVEQIAADLQRVLTVREALPNFQDIAPDEIELSDDDGWKTFWFLGYGVWDDANCLRCPTTAALLRAVPGLTTAFFSVLGPGKSLPPHVGPYRGVLRHHLALLVPEPAHASGIRVGGEVRHWERGRSLVFDDTYLHDAWNGTDSDRVVLFIDVQRPLRRPADRANAALIRAVSRSRFVREARARHLAREEDFRRAWEHAVPWD